ncbi:unnamed protein product [Gongylonema pulchrum]|uniref:C-type lectin domain-containing protein n=1 Tax=Gongylonema pulchrum TaxID=637853 RepID=A0A183CXL2_9BILA|nr:unnamed protein product [Gongylonema pulchrum]
MRFDTAVLGRHLAGRHTGKISASKLAWLATSVNTLFQVYAYETFITQSSARKICSADGGELASIHSVEENNFVNGMLLLYFSGDVCSPHTGHQA